MMPTHKNKKYKEKIKGFVHVRTNHHCFGESDLVYAIFHQSYRQKRIDMKSELILKYPSLHSNAVVLSTMHHLHPSNSEEHVDISSTHRDYLYYSQSQHQFA